MFPNPRSSQSHSSSKSHRFAQPYFAVVNSVTHGVRRIWRFLSPDSNVMNSTVRVNASMINNKFSKSPGTFSECTLPLVWSWRKLVAKWDRNLKEATLVFGGVDHRRKLKWNARQIVNWRNGFLLVIWLNRIFRRAF